MAQLDKMLYWIGHASFYIKATGATVFIDPVWLPKGLSEKADIILITHAHQDHLSREDITGILKPTTKIICAPGTLKEGEMPNITIAAPGFKSEVDGIKIEAVPAYNTNSERLDKHPKSNSWVGYIVEADGMRFYHPGDTDIIPEMSGIKNIDVLLVPMSGTYVMDVDEAIKFIRLINPKTIVPMHYKMVLGKEKADAAEEKLRKEFNNVVILKEIQEPKYSF